MPKPCKSCGKPPNAHFIEGFLSPPKGCRIVELSPLDAWVVAVIKKAPRKRYIALPGAKIKLTQGTQKHAAFQVIVRAGAGGIVPNDILAEVRKVKGMENMTLDKLAKYLFQLRRTGAVASVPVKQGSLLCR